MQGLSGLFGDPAGAQRDAAHLEALRAQRTLLRGILDEVNLAAAQVTASALDDSWRSAAQQEFLERLHELAGDILGAARTLEAALDSVHASIAWLTAE